MNPDTLKTRILQLAVSFRNAPASPSHKHVDVYALIEQIGGRTAIFYGMWLATPSQHRWKRSARGYDVASALSDYAATL